MSKLKFLISTGYVVFASKGTIQHWPRDICSAPETQTAMAGGRFSANSMQDGKGAIFSGMYRLEDAHGHAVRHL
jgi:hypothetical protein